MASAYPGASRWLDMIGGEASGRPSAIVPMIGCRGIRARDRWSADMIDTLTNVFNHLRDLSSQVWDQGVRHMSCPTEARLQLLQAGLAVAAAVLWIRSARVEIPSTGRRAGRAAIVRRPPGEEMTIGDLGKISEAFGLQSRRSARAAWCAAIAAFLGAILVYAPACLNMG
jgi:hypothetical protein